MTTTGNSNSTRSIVNEVKNLKGYTQFVYTCFNVGIFPETLASQEGQLSFNFEVLPRYHANARNLLSTIQTCGDSQIFFKTVDIKYQRPFFPKIWVTMKQEENLFENLTDKMNAKFIPHASPNQPFALMIGLYNSIERCKVSLEVCLKKSSTNYTLSFTFNQNSHHAKYSKKYFANLGFTENLCDENIVMLFSGDAKKTYAKMESLMNEIRHNYYPPIDI